LEQIKNTWRLGFRIYFCEIKMQDSHIGENHMTATVHVLHSKPSPIGSFLRVGHTGHRKLEALIAASRLRFRRFVFDAAHVDERRDLLATLQRAGCEIVLDPNAAEAATAGRFRQLGQPHQDFEAKTKTLSLQWVRK
jgi:hypothetical protein